MKAKQNKMLQGLTSELKKIVLNKSCIREVELGIGFA